MVAHVYEGAWPTSWRAQQKEKLQIVACKGVVEIKNVRWICTIPPKQADGYKIGVIRVISSQYSGDE